MPVIRATKDKDFTVMSIHHLRDTRLSLKAIGLFSIILSLPPEWKFSVAGLAAITKDGITSVRGALNELEQNGYLTRKRVHRIRKNRSRKSLIWRRLRWKILYWVYSGNII